MVQKSLVLIALLQIATGSVATFHAQAWAQEQSRQMRDDLAQFAMDLRVGMQRANLTDQQREPNAEGSADFARFMAERRPYCRLPGDAKLPFDSG